MTSNPTSGDGVRSPPLQQLDRDGPIVWTARMLARLERKRPVRWIGLLTGLAFVGASVHHMFDLVIKPKGVWERSLPHC